MDFIHKDKNKWMTIFIFVNSKLSYDILFIFNKNKLMKLTVEFHDFIKR